MVNKMKECQRPRGTIDLLPENNQKRQYAIKAFRDIAKRGGFREIETPVIERANLFSIGVGKTTDIVSKEMYIFKDKGGRNIALRPESTAPISRAYLENKLSLTASAGIVRLFYIEPMFRYERPQAGRYRQHTQYGVELIGDGSIPADIDVISTAILFLKEIGLTGLSLEINSVGCSKCRGNYEQKLVQCLERKTKELCEDCQIRLKKNPLRIFDCKNENCQKVIEKAPSIIQFLCQDCEENFKQLCKCLQDLGFEYKINPKLVRGLDYYTRTVFEIISSELGGQNTVIGGGRYDGLIELLGGKPTPAIGFGGGLERLLLTMQKQGIQFPEEERLDIYIVVLGDSLTTEAMRIMNQLRENRISTVVSPSRSGIKSQLAKASKARARYALIIGENEWQKGSVSLKNLDTSSQETFPIEKLIEKLEMRKY